MNADKLKTVILLMFAGIALGAWLTPVAAHEGHNHGARAQRSGVSPGHDDVAGESPAEVKSGNYARSIHVYVVPDVTLVNANARPIRMRELLAADGPVLLNFTFTACTAICPELNREFSRMPAKMGAAPRLRMISVSIDPDNDSPAQLKAYARQFGAGANWQFLTGSREDVETLQRAFDSYHDNKLNPRDAEPLIFLRPGPGGLWLRINGLASAEELAREYRNVVQN